MGTVSLLRQDALASSNNKGELADATLVSKATDLAPVLDDFKIVNKTMVNVPYATIVNRAQIPDLSQDLGVRFGIQRIMGSQAFQLQTNETGPNGELIWGLIGDDLGLIRFAGNWGSSINNYGSFIVTGSANDFIEITFYGTALNLVTSEYNDGRTAVASVDGGAFGSNIYSNASTVRTGLGFAQNVITPIASNLAQGVHTVKILSSSGFLVFFGVEIINQSMVVNPGSYLTKGKALSLSAQQSLNYNSGFESGVLGTKGGCVATYIKSDGTIGKSITPTDAVALYMTNANHSNEVVVRTHHWREFGCGQTTGADFSLISSPASPSFTLDDNATSLSATTITTGSEMLTLSSNSTYINLWFVGTGLDIVRYDQQSGTEAVGNYPVLIDGAVVYNLNTTGVQALRTEKICSGLPFGSHCVTIQRNTATTYSVGIKQFIVYAPKAPAIPANAELLSTYYIPANFAANTSGALSTVSTGVVRASLVRGVNFVEGTGGATPWTFSGNVGYNNGTLIYTDKVNAYFEYTFFGVGFDLRSLAWNSGSSNVQVTLQNLGTGGSFQNLTSTNFPSLSYNNYGGTTFNPATGIYGNYSAGNNVGAGFVVNGLQLSLYKVRFTNNTASAFLYPSTFDIISPVYAYGDNLVTEQNTLRIGNNSLKDARKVVNSLSSKPKACGMTVGVTSSPTVAVPTPVIMPDLSATVTTTTGKLLIMYSMDVFAGTAGHWLGAHIVVDGVPYGQDKLWEAQVSGNAYGTIADMTIANVGPGQHKIDVYWYAGYGNGMSYGTQRNLTWMEF